MILTVPLAAGTLLANVAYRWIIAGAIGGQLTAGITQPSASFPVFRFDVVPPDGAEELIVYDSTDLTNWNAGEFLLGKLRVGPTASPVVVVPGAPSDLSLCRVYGYLETLDNQPAAKIKVDFQLMSLPAKSERIIAGPTISAKTDSDGRIANANGDPWIDLQRNDLLSGTTTYRVNCVKAGLFNVDMTLDTDLFDLSILIT
jgi:hypothetical protein